MKRFAALLYAILSYTVFFATFLYLIGFIGNLFVPKAIDGPLMVPIWQALLTNIGLIVLFGVQHSVMARPWFKVWWTRFVPQAVERSTYVLFSSLALIAIFVFWQPMGGNIWTVESPMLYNGLMVLFFLGWGILLLSTFLINHFDLTGLRQAWLYFRGKDYTDLKFRVPGLYKFVRHPLYLGFLIAFWAAPDMSWTRLFFASLMTLYILLGIQWEEKDLIAHFGKTYLAYKRAVPMIFPSLSIRKHRKPTYETAFKKSGS
ncbi:MAG: methanethiol S-methyltransferase [Bacteroidota bacterium]